MPCKVNVFVQDGQVFLSTMRPQVIARFFPEAGLVDLAAEVDALLLQILEEVK